MAHPAKPFHYTPKGTPRRQVIIDEYKEEIERGYINLETTSTIEANSFETLDLEETHLYVSQLVEQIMGRKLGEDDDIFLFGCDRFVTLP